MGSVDFWVGSPTRKNPFSISTVTASGVALSVNFTVVCFWIRIFSIVSYNMKFPVDANELVINASGL